MTTSTIRLAALAATLTVAALGPAAPAAAGDSDLRVLDRVVKDLGLDLSGTADDRSVRVPLAPQHWTLLGRVQPYASLGPRAYTLADEPTGVAIPPRETDDFARGVGVGAGANWQLTERLQLFGEYHLLNMGGREGQPAGVLGRREIETPGLKGGFSIRF